MFIQHFIYMFFCFQQKTQITALIMPYQGSHLLWLPAPVLRYLHLPLFPPVMNCIDGTDGENLSLLLLLL